MSADNVHRFLIAYDIVSDHWRNRIAHTLKSYGDRIQYSVFIADCKPARLVRLRSSVAEIVVRDEDSVLICDLGPVRAVDASRFSFIGLQRPVTPSDAIVV